MSLHIIYGRSGSGKSTACMDRLEEIMAQDGRAGLFMIVPEQYTYSAEKELVKRLGVTSPRTVEVLSFKRLAHYAANLAGGASSPRLTPAVRWILLRRIVDSLSGGFAVFGRLSRQNGFCEVASSIISEFKRYNVTPQALKDAAEHLGNGEMLKQKLTDLYAIYSEFEKTVASKFLNPDDELTLLARTIDATPWLFAGDAFFFDGFADFTPQEFEVVKALLTRAGTVTVALCADQLTSGVQRGADVFCQQKRTYAQLKKAAQSLGVKMEPPTHLNHAYRYTCSPGLAHLEENLSKFSLAPYHKPPDDIRLLSADSRYGEIEWMAGEILDLVRRGACRFRDISVTARSLDHYEQLIESVFPKFGIPYFMDKKSGVSEHPAAFSLLAAIDVQLKNWSYESVFSYLKSGFAPVRPERLHLLENYVLATGVRGKSWLRQKDWPYLPNALFDPRSGESPEDYLLEINAIRREAAQPLDRLHTALNSAQNTTEMCAAVYDFMVQTRMDERVKELSDRFTAGGLADLGAQYRQIWNIIITALDELNTAAGEEKLTVRQFRDLLCSALDAHDIGIIPSLSDSVAVSSAERSRSGQVLYSFVIGVNEGAFPLINSTEGILSDRDRDRLQGLGLTLAPSTSQQAFNEHFIAYSALCRPSRGLYVSYPVSGSSGEALRPSIIIYRLKRLFPLLKETDLTLKPPACGMEQVASPAATFEHAVRALRLHADGGDVAPVWHGVWQWFKGSPEWADRFDFAAKAVGYRPQTAAISAELIEKLMKEAGGELVMDSSVSRLERYARCPFSHFSCYLLRARPRAVASLESADIGSFAHKVIEELSRAVRDGPGSWQAAGHDWLQAAIASICDRLSDEILAQFGDRSSRKKALLARLKRMSSQAAMMIALHLKRGQFIPLGYEIEFGQGCKYAPITLDLGAGKKIRLRGKIDRADVYTDGSGRKFIRIIDYKTGEKNFKISDLYFGLEVQLGVYLDALCSAEDAQPCGMLYFRLHDPIVELPPGTPQDKLNAELANQYKMNGLLLADREIIEKMDPTAGGDGGLLPVKYNANGCFSAASSVASMQQFAAMRRRLRKVLRHTARELMGGNVSISPVKYSNMTGCDYCDFLDICHFDQSAGCRYRILQPLKAAEAWDRIVKEGGEDVAAMD